jgi:23S rRNA (cytosine1962-C5)-methyltransferase
MIIETQKQKDYELIDSGEGLKLERYGKYVLSRPDPEAIWKKSENKEVWKNADLEFIRNGNKAKWVKKEGVPEDWQISFGELNFLISPSSFKHTGLFPEQLPNWQWMAEIIEKNKNSYKEKIKVLNLFAYTGGATLACAKAGAEVCHVDGSKKACDWARKNAELSGLRDAPIRWIVEDCLKFLKREAKRGSEYDCIIMDPPSFGHGPKDELWKIEEGFIELVDLCKNVLSDRPLFILINGYTAGYSAIAYENNLRYLTKGYEGRFEMGELAIRESSGDRLLPCGIFARWQRNQ